MAGGIWPEHKEFKMNAKFCRPDVPTAAFLIGGKNYGTTHLDSDLVHVACAVRIGVTTNGTLLSLLDGTEKS